MKFQNISLPRLDCIDPTDLAGRGSTLVIEALAVSKKHGDVQALREVSLRVAKGSTVALIGPNGAGKSSLVDILVGLKKPDSGDVRVLGMDVVRNPRANAERIGVQFQDARMFGRLTVNEYLKLFYSFYSKGTDLTELCARLGLQDHLDKKVQTLSGGYRQRLALALALVNDPELVFLDEPTSGLDPIVRSELWDLIGDLKAGNKTVLFSTHYMEEAEALADHLVMIAHGRVIAEGTVQQILKKADDCTSLDDAYKFFAQKPAQEAVC